MPPDPTAQWVAFYRSLGWATVRIPPLAKAPRERDWPDVDYPPESFAPSDNIGIKLGTPSNGLTDVDLDCPEAVALAPLFLKPTSTFGRSGAGKTPGRVIPWDRVGRSRHYLYRCATKTKKPAQSHIEIRSTGLQTVFPGSIHESGEPIEWTEFNPIAEVSEPELHQMIGRLAFATILARVWPQLAGNKHHAVLALAGALWHDGWSLDEAITCLLPAMMLDGSNEPHREHAIRSTWDESEKARVGWPTVDELIGPVDAKALRRAAEMVPSVSKHSAVAGALELHDVGNAERFMREHGEDLRYVQGMGWMQWNGSIWEQQHPTSLVIRSLRTLLKTGEELRDPAVIKWANQSFSAGHISAVETIASKVDKRTTGLDLDANTWVFNCTNGLVDLRTGMLHPTSRDELITKRAGCEYDPAAQAPRFLQFLKEVFAHDVTMASYMLRFLGYCLTGEIREQVFQVWHGHGSNGKSTMIELLLYVLGDYGQRMAEDLLIAKRQGKDSAAPSPDVARMRGARFAVGSEVGEGTRWNEPLVKQLTGGDRIVARHLHREHIEFDPTWKLALAVNYKPIVRGADFGIWRRIHLVPFEVRFSGPSLDTNLLQTLKSEAPGVLAMLVRGCLEWQRTGLLPPNKVIGAVNDYKAEHDVIGAFLNECVRPVERGAVSKSQLYGAFRRWATANGEYVFGNSGFSSRLAERGLHESADKKSWIEVALLEVTF